MNLFTIKDLENLSGIKAHTIRIWEQRYNFIKPNRTKTNIRYYSSEELKTILNVSLLNKYGFKVSHINKMTDVELQDKIMSLSHVEAQQERLINELIQSMIEMKTDRFETVLNSFIATKGEGGYTLVNQPYQPGTGTCSNQYHSSKNNCRNR